MKIIALETSAFCDSVSALLGYRVLGIRELPAGTRSSQTLAPAIQSQLVQVGWDPSDIELVAVTVGPGSFTGLRVGVTTAKTLAYAVGAHVLAVNTLEAVAAQAAMPCERLVVVSDAQRRQLFVAEFVVDAKGRTRPLGPTGIVDRATWLAQLDDTVTLSGPALERLRDQLPIGVRLLDSSLWHPNAAAVGRLAYQRFREGQRDDIWSLVPEYYRRSAAEEKRDGNQVIP